MALPIRILMVFWIALHAIATQAGTCFAFDDTTGRLVVFDQQAPLVIRKNVLIPTFGGDQVESAYFDGVNNRYYIIRQTTPNSLGYIDPLTDTYIQVTPSTGLGTSTTPTIVNVGTGAGANRITGLSVNPVTGKWYTIHVDNYLFEIDPTTGVFVPGAFAGQDYLRIRNEGGTVIPNDLEDLVFDATGALQVFTNDGGGTTRLNRNISFLTGYRQSSSVLTVGGINTGLIEGSTLDHAGNIRVVGGANNAANNRIVSFLNVATGELTPIYTLPELGLSDYESLGCNPLPERSDLEISKSVAQASVIPGGTTSFTIGIYNRGVDPAFRVLVQDALPPGITVLSSNIVGTCASCSFDGGTGLWSIDQILLGQRITLNFVMSTAGVTPNTVVTNRAQITQSCSRATGPCLALADPDSTPNNKAGNYSPTEDDESVVQLTVTPAPAVGKSFVPASGDVGTTAMLVLTFTNPSTTTVGSLTAIFTDTYPANMVNAATPNPQTNCLGVGAITAAAGANSVSVPNTRAIPINGSCTVTVVIRALSFGVFDNGIPAGALVTTVGNNFLAVTGTYVAVPVNVGVVKSFVPNSMGANQTALLRLTLSNPTNITASFTTVFNDVYPAGLVNAAAPNPQTNCIGSGGPTASAGSNSVTLPITRAIAPLVSCTLTVVVTSSSIGVYTNTIAAGSLTTNVGQNNAPAIDALTVSNPYVVKTFTPSSVQANQVSRLTITFVNPRSSLATLTAVFTDLYPTGLRNATTTNVSDDCAGGVAAATANSNSVTLPVNTQIPAFGQCSLGVDVYGTATGTYTNTIPAGSLTTSLGTNTSAVTATLTISLLADLRVTKVANNTATLPSQTTVFTVTVANLGPSAVTGAPLTDTLSGWAITGSVIGTGAGAGTATFTTSTTSINASMTLPVNGSVSFRVVALPSIFNGFITNTAIAQPPAGTVDANPFNNNATVTVFINPAAALSVSKSNGTNTIAGGATTVYTITFANAGLSAADGAIVKDTPSAGLICGALTCNETGGASCGGMTIASFLSAGGQILPSLPANSTVTVLLSCRSPLTGF